MRLVRLSALSLLFLIGAGCSLGQPLVSPRIAEQLGTSLEERPLNQYGGFGELPQTPAAQLRPGRRGSVRVLAEFPSLPPTFTVLRVKSGRPNDTQLRNISNTMGLPEGIIGEAPEGQELMLEWKDDHGVRWQAQGSERRIEFTDETLPLATLTVSSWPESTGVLQNVQTFLQEHGIGTKRYGTPYVSPDWPAWWQAEQAAGRCMDKGSLTLLRALAASPLLDTPPPNLPAKQHANCVQPEFPSRMVVRFNAAQDGQAILKGDGSPLYAASLVVDASTGAIVSGWFTLPVDPDRSDYPGLSFDEARERLARGGQGGTPNGDVTVTTITLEWFAVAEFLYPALVGHGTIEYPDATTAPYRIVVPLVRN